MARPQNCRKVGFVPECDFFKPRGIPLSSLETVRLSIDELEAVRLADYEGLYQSVAADTMNVSRQTFGRILDIAHKKIAEALVWGKALQVEGGEIDMNAERSFKCANCNNQWDLPFGTGRPDNCPKCGSINFHRVDDARGGRGGSGRRNRGGCRANIKGENS